MRRRWRSVFPAHANTGDPNGPVRGLSANQLACALISMMARSTTRSNQRPDTLMQDRICQVDEPLATRGRTIHLGQKRRFASLPAISGLPRTTDIVRPPRLGRFVPDADG